MHLPSPWVERWAPLVPKTGLVLDLACGEGRHAFHFAALGHQVLAVDRQPALPAHDRVEVLEFDLEQGSLGPLEGRRFAGIVVTNYLHRPLFPWLAQALEPAGVLIYETFARGQAVYGKPTNPAYLLEPGELKMAFGYSILGYEETATRQRLCARQALAHGKPKRAAR